jgi:hypothetical protein
MLSRELVVKRAQEFKAKHGVLDEQDENVVATLHLMNTHDLDLHAAQDQTSRGGNDHGIDAWHYDSATTTLTIYQSKLTSSKAMALKGLEALTRACEWLATVLREAELDVPATNSGIFNLARCLASHHQAIRKVCCILISPFDSNELDDEDDFTFARNDIAKSALYGLLRERGGSLDVRTEQYSFNRTGVVPPASYSVAVREDTSLNVDGKVQLDVVLMSLESLVSLFRRRGPHVFEKNVRLYLSTKEAKARLETPMEETLEQICSGSVNANIFPFYHVGVTLSATGCTKSDGSLALDAPYIINGCQTVNIASRYLARLEKAKALEKIERFKAIQVVAKVVRRASDAQLREIANCNNRQNPIEAWQLFSNDPIHVQIEASLRDVGVFYERQKGRFEAEIIRLNAIQTYRNTNRTYVLVVPLGQVICLSRRQWQLAAKPSEVFVNKEKHDSVFTKDLPESPHDIIWAYNAHKAAKRALQNYLSQPTLDNEQTHRIFKKPIVLQSMHFIAMMDLYQRRRDVGAKFIFSLNKIAAPTLVNEAEVCYRSVVKKTKEFYLAESKNLEVEVSAKKMEGFLMTLCTQVGLDFEGPMPFTKEAIEWEVDEQEAEV